MVAILDDVTGPNNIRIPPREDKVMPRPKDHITGFPLIVKSFRYIVI